MRIHMCVKLRDKGVLVPKPGQQSSWCSALAIISLFLNVLRIWTLCSQRSRKPVYITDRLWSLFLFTICDHFFPWICLVYFYTSQRMSLENAQHKKKKRFKYTFIVPKQVKSVIVGLRKWWKFLDAAKPPPSSSSNGRCSNKPFGCSIHTNVFSCFLLPLSNWSSWIYCILHYWTHLTAHFQ